MCVSKQIVTTCMMQQFLIIKKWLLGTGLFGVGMVLLWLLLGCLAAALCVCVILWREQDAGELESATAAIERETVEERLTSAVASYEALREAEVGAKRYQAAREAQQSKFGGKVVDVEAADVEAADDKAAAAAAVVEGDGEGARKRAKVAPMDGEVRFEEAQAVV